MKRREFLKRAGLVAGAAAVPGMTSRIQRARADSNPKDWPAKWIWPATGEEDKPNTWACFRKSFTLKSVPNSAPMSIAVDSKYWLWLNGELVVFEGGLKRGPTPERTYYDTLDISSALKPGENTICLLVCYFGKDGFSHNDSGKGGLLAHLDLGNRSVSSDSSWKATIHPAYGDTGKPKPNYRLPESNIRFDARKAIEGMTDTDFDDGDWPDAQERGTPPCKPWGSLEERPTPLWKDYGVRDYENATEFPEVSDGEPIVAELPYNAHITPCLAVKAPAGLTIDIRTDHYKVTGNNAVRMEYVTREGEQSHESPGWMNGEKVIYRIPKGVEIKALKYRETGFNSRFAGNIKCNDDFHNTLCRKAVRTLYVTMRDTFMDCPDRERAQWWGDMVIQLGQSFYALDRKTDSLIRKGMKELMRWQRDDGTIYSPVPAGNWDKELPLQMLASVGYYGFWTYYRYSGDADTLRELYPRVRRYLLDVWKLKPNGLVTQRDGDWTWLDWGKNKDAPVLYNGWYYLALRGLSNMARLFGKRDDLKEIARRMKSIRDRFNDSFWTGTAYDSPAHDGPPDDRAQGLPVVAGLAEPSMYDSIAEVLQEQYFASPYMEKYILEALFQMDRPEQALARMKKRYRPMVENDISTLWEQFPEGGTKNHSWTGGPLTLLYQYAAGVAPLEPGFEKFQVKPRMGSLESIEVSFPTEKGEISAELRQNDKRFDLELTAPSSTTARVCIPDSFERIEANGKLVWEFGKSVDANGVLFTGERDGYVRFDVASGDWHFAASAD